MGIFVESLACFDSQIVPVDVFAPQPFRFLCGGSVARFGRGREDLQWRPQSDEVQHGEGTRIATTGDHPGSINVVRTGDAFYGQTDYGAHPRDHEGVDDVARLLLVEGNWKHADPFGESDDACRRP